MIEEWNEILLPAFKTIQEKYFKENWFVEHDINHKRIEFGNKNEYWFTYYFISERYHMISAYRISTPNEISEFVFEQIQKNLTEAGADVLLAGSNYASTGKRSEYVMEIMEYISDHITKNRSYKLPIYSFIPYFGWKNDSVLVIDENKTEVMAFASLIDVKNFHIKEKDELKKMTEAENELHEWILEKAKDVRVCDNGIGEKMKDYLHDRFFAAFRFQKKETRDSVFYESRYTIDNEWQNYRDESLEKVLEHAKKDIKNYIEKALA